MKNIDKSKTALINDYLDALNSVNEIPQSEIALAFAQRREAELEAADHYDDGFTGHSIANGLNISIDSANGIISKLSEEKKIYRSRAPGFCVSWHPHSS